MERVSLWIRITYAICLLGATANHLRVVVDRGWLPTDLPLGTAVYWSSLTFFDPAAAILLFVRPRIGVVMTLAIILSDVLHNLWFRARHLVKESLYNDVMSNPFMMSQIAFLVFVAVTVPFLLKHSARTRGDAAHLPQ